MEAVINQAVSDLVYLIVSGVLVYGVKLIKKAQVYFTSKTSESQRSMLNMIANDAVILIQQQWKGLDGAGKFSQAVQHAVQVANHHGLNLNTQDIQAAIESAYQKAKVDNLLGDNAQKVAQ